MYKRLSISSLQSGQWLLLIILLTFGHSGESCMKSDSGKQSLSSDAWTPTTRKDSLSQTMHENFLLHSAENYKQIKLAFFGDSITQGWSEEGNATFQKFYGKFGAANYGISGDKTQHLLWRIRNGELDHIKPKIIVVLIGTNNLGTNKDTEISTAIKIIVQEFRKKLPRSKIILVSILPRNNEELTQRVYTINKKIMQLDDGVMTCYFDLGRYFYIDGRIVTELYQEDLLHLNYNGYEMWASAMNHLMMEMLEIVFEPE